LPCNEAYAALPRQAGSTVLASHMGRADCGAVRWAATYHLPPPPPLPGRLLDPQLATSYPSAILARERAIVCNLEFIKCIIAQGGLEVER